MSQAEPDAVVADARDVMALYTSEIDDLLAGYHHASNNEIRDVCRDAIVYDLQNLALHLNALALDLAGQRHAWQSSRASVPGEGGA